MVIYREMNLCSTTSCRDIGPPLFVGQSDYGMIPQDTAGSLDMGVFNGIYHIITWNRHFIINNSEYLHLFLFLLVKLAMQ